MKVRIGVGMGTLPSVTPPTATPATPATPAAPARPSAKAAAEEVGLGTVVDMLAELGFDSIWLPEILTAPTLDPVSALGFAAARQPRLKLGTTMLLPGRNLVRLAKELATLDVLSAGRLLVTLVPGLARSKEATAAGVPPEVRGDRMDEMLPLLRRLWDGETVTYDGPSAHLDAVRVEPQPVQQPLEVWTGGLAAAAVERCGRLADGWLPSACTPEEVAARRPRIEEAAARAGRTISPEHFGVSIGYSLRPLDEATTRVLATLRKGVDPALVVPVGHDGLRAAIERFLDVGFSKFVVRPIQPPGSWRRELEQLASVVLGLQT
jgi:probable F420-dependent oxidoreductase